MADLIAQTEILDSICQIIYNEVDGCSRIECTFEIYGESEEKTASTTLIHEKDGHVVNSAISDHNIFKLVELVVALYNRMKSQSGTGWEAMKITIDGAGQASAKFHYPEII